MRNTDAQPTVSKAYADGTLVELIYEPEAGATGLVVARPDGAVSIETEWKAPSGERLIPYTATNNLIATECVLLPSALGAFESKAALLAEIRAFLDRYVDLPALFADVAAHYVLLAWVYDAFNELPYLRFRGDFGTGKTRALTALGSLCYKPFFASGASTVSPIFHVLEAFRGTLVLDEADVRFSDATASLTKILNNGNVQGMPVLRTMSNAQRELNPKAYRVFGPKLIGMRGRFTDLALESRFLTHETSGRALRADIPIQLPPAMRGEARALRNKLLVWRLRHRRQIGLEVAPPAAGLGPRTLQIALPLLSLMDDPGLRELFVGMLGDHEGALGRARGYAPDAHLLESVLECFDVEAGAGASVADITARFNTRATPYLGRAMTPRWVGGALRAHFGLATVKSHGVYVIPAETRPRVLELVRDRRDAAGTLSVIPDADDHSE